MRNSMVAFALMVVSTARLASAAGLQVDTQQARATGMGTAVVASDNDASSILYNPAGLAQGKGLELQLGDTLIAPAVRYIDPTTGHSTVNHFGIVPPPHLYAAYGITDNLTVGFGIIKPGLMTEGAFNHGLPAGPMKKSRLRTGQNETVPALCILRF